MESLIVMGVIIGGLIYLGSKSPSTPKSSNQSIMIPPKQLTSTNTAARSETTGEFKRSSEGFIPSDRCEECGGTWVKHVNKVNGGRFFGCANYPRCKNTRDKQISEKQCSNGHKRTAHNTQYDAAGRRRCLDCFPPQNLTKSSPRSHSSGSHRFPRGSESTNAQGQSRKYCRNGHERTAANTYTRPDGERECRICRRNARRESY